MYMALSIQIIEAYIRELPLYGDTEINVLICREMGGEHILHSADGSINMGDSVLIKVSGSDDDPEKDVLVSWSIQVSDYVHPPGGWIYYFCFFRRPMSGVRCPASCMVSAHLKEKY